MNQLRDFDLFRGLSSGQCSHVLRNLVFSMNYHCRDLELYVGISQAQRDWMFDKLMRRRSHDLAAAQIQKLDSQSRQ